MKSYTMVIAGCLLSQFGCGGGTAPVEAPEGESAAADHATGDGAPGETASEETASGGTVAGSDSVGDQAPAADSPPEPDAPPAGTVSPEPEGDVKEASRARITDRNIVISGKVLFETGKATLKKVSYPVLDEVVYAIEKHPEIIKLQVVGHTDSDGDAKANRRLSQRRATTVMKYLTKKGIERDRLSAVGVGEDMPIATNDTEEGKDKNRRVEFVIVERAQVKAVTHTTSTAGGVNTNSRKASNDEVEELIKEKGLEKDLH